MSSCVIQKQKLRNNCPIPTFSPPATGSTEIFIIILLLLFYYIIIYYRNHNYYLLLSLCFSDEGYRIADETNNNTESVIFCIISFVLLGSYAQKMQNCCIQRI